MHNSNSVSQKHSHSADRMVSNEELPKQFLSSLRILFDILDENRTGFIRLRDFESRWSDDGVRGLPPGIVDSLRKVTPSNGLLSFEKFVSGLKLVLQSKGPRAHTESDNRRPFVSKEKSHLAKYQSQIDKSGSLDNYYLDKIDTKESTKSLNNGQPYADHFYRGQPPSTYSNSNNNKSVISGMNDNRRHQSDSNADGFKSFEHQDIHPNSARPNSSKPNETNYNDVPIRAADVRDYQSPTASALLVQDSQFYHGRGGHQDNRAPNIPPRIGRNTSHLKKSQSGPELHHPQSPPAVPPRENSNSRIISDLRQWQRDWTINQNRTSDHDRSKGHDGRQEQYAIYANIDQFQKRRENQLAQDNAVPHKTSSVRRHGSGRRHTLTSGIDQSVMKRMKQLEEETSILRAGLSMLDSARDWYIKQLSGVADKQAMLGKVNYNDNSLEAHQERMNFQRAQVSEINQHLKTLLESSEKGFPLHMNLAMPRRSSPPVAPRDKASQTAAVMERNRRLLEEVQQKNDKIAQLEKEKASLVRDMFETRSKHKGFLDDTTFM